ncbi:hypothetical protein BLNAU_7379 [Blattamonas nauphoetae]|uniref:Uncharacterized protein n=1 Tax=Blattamonas nauphoetae TaxID=2049346 RepID=A0ABQ9Y1Z6_9EUKA|nr:hypothetical protein BLNAU_7379 [Blattamonas nauphoetae]
MFCQKSSVRRKQLCEITQTSALTKSSHVSNRRNPYDEDGRLLLDPRNEKKTHAKMKCRLHTTIQKYICSQYLSFEKLQVLVDNVQEFHGWAGQTELVDDPSAPPNCREFLTQHAESVAELSHIMNVQAPYMAVSDSAELNSLPPFAYAPSLATGKPDVSSA